VREAHKRRSRKGLRSKTSASIMPQSENACWQEHFSEAVDAAGARSAQAAKPQRLAKQDFCKYYNIFRALLKEINKKFPQRLFSVEIRRTLVYNEKNTIIKVHIWKRTYSSQKKTISNSSVEAS